MKYKARLNQQKGLKKRKLTTFILATLTSISSGAFADDTEIFYGQNTTQANVLFVVDTSGSMAWYDSPNPDNNPATKDYQYYPYFEGDTSRLERLKEALTEILSTTNDINVGLTSYAGSNYRGAGHVFLQEVKPITEIRTEMLASIQTLSPAGSTPSVEAVFRGGQYYRGELLKDSGGTYDSPMESACQSNHIVLLTDGTPTEDTATEVTIANAIFDDNTKRCADASVAGGTCGAELTKYLFDEDHSSLPGTNNVITHTIGFNFSEPWLSTLSGPDAGNGKHFNAGSASDLAAAFDSILKVANSSSNTFAAPAITLDQFTRFSNRDDIYLALFQPNNTQRWSGNLKRYQFDNKQVRDVNGNLALDTSTGNFVPGAQSYWSTTADGDNIPSGGAANLLNQDPRPVYTYNGGNKALTDTENALHEDNNLVTAAMLGVPAADRTNLMQWARGVDVDNESDGSSTRLSMGDPLHSRPVILTYGGTEASPDSVAFVGTNEGFLHAIDTSNGQEVFSFIPSDLLGNLDTYYKNERTINRLYGLDGDLTLWSNDINNNGVIEKGTDHAYLYMGMRRGGSQYHALDVTDKAKPEFLWSIDGGPDGTTGFEKLAQSWSKPTLSKVAVNGTATDVLIFAGGYNSTLDHSNTRSPDTIGNDIFIVDATTGALIWNSATAANSLVDTAAMQYSIPSDLRIIDVNGDKLADQIYVGDMGGQVWRFDIDNDNTNVDSLVSGGVIANLSSDSKISDNRRFFYRPDVAVVNSDGQRFLSISIGSGNRANPLGSSVDNRFYMIRQTSISNAPEGYGIINSVASTASNNVYRPVTEDDLYNATKNLIQDTDAAIATAESAALNASAGWLLEMESSGEKVLASSLTVSNQIIFTSYLPDTGTNAHCSPAIGSGRSYSVSLVDATPTVGNEPISRYSELANPGIPNEPIPFIDADGELSILVDLNEVANPEYREITKVFWTEQPDY